MPGEPDPLAPITRELRAIIERTRMNARREERQRIVAALRKTAATMGERSLKSPFGFTAAIGANALAEAARALEDEGA